MPFPTNSALEKAVIADCDNDLPRLVYADWLDENGDPARATFIRTQIALHDKHPADADYPDLLETHREAVDRVLKRDFEPSGLPFHLEFDSGLFDSTAEADDIGLQRGFPFWVDAQTGDEEHAGDPQVEASVTPSLLPLLKQRTTVRGVRYGYDHVEQLHDGPSGSGPTTAEAFAGDEWAGLQGFEAGADNPAYSVAPQVARSPMARTLRRLWLSVLSTDDAETLAKAKFPHLQRWTAYHGFRCTPASLQKLTAAGWFRRLRRVLCPFRKAHAKMLWPALAAAPHLHTVFVWGQTDGSLAQLAARRLRSLGRLHLHALAPTDADLNGLVRADLPRLAVFEMNNSDLTNDGLSRLLAADWWDRLRILKLDDCRSLGDQGVAALSASSAAAGLRSLTLATGRTGRAGFASLARSYPALTTLNLGTAYAPKAKPADLAAFAAAFALPRLRHLSLDCWPLGDAGAMALAKNPSVSNLTRLDLSSTDVGVKGVKALLASPHLQRLIHLNLNGCNGGKATAALLDSGVLPDLAYCWLPTGVSKSALEKLRAARPNVLFIA